MDENERSGSDSESENFTSLVNKSIHPPKKSQFAARKCSISELKEESQSNDSKVS